MQKKKYLYLVLLILLNISLISAVGSELNLSCQARPTFNIQEKEYCLGYIPSSYSNETFKCVSYVSYQGEVLQTNPEYRERSGSFVSVFGSDEETREVFIPANLIVNFYYTKKNILPDYTYTLNLVCHSPVSRLTGNTTLQIGYENFDFVFMRVEWAKRNVGYLTAGMIMLAFLLIGGVIIWKIST